MHRTTWRHFELPCTLGAPIHCVDTCSVLPKSDGLVDGGALMQVIGDKRLLQNLTSFVMSASFGTRFGKFFSMLAI